MTNLETEVAVVETVTGVVVAETEVVETVNEVLAEEPLESAAE